MEIDYFRQLCRHASERAPQTVFQTLRDELRESMTWSQTMAAVREISGALRQSGIQPGDRVALLMENDHQWVLAFLGTVGTGAVAVPLDPAQSTERLIDTLAHSGTRALFGSVAFAAHLEAIRAALPQLQIWDGKRPGQDPGGEWPLVAHDPDADFLLVYTGGTTGTPKGVRLSLRALLTTIDGTTKVFPLTPEDHILSILPLFHIMAIQASILGPLYKGSRITYLISKEPKRILAAFAEENITVFLCVPLFYYQIRRRIFEEVARQPKAKQMVFQLLLKVSGAVRRRLGWNAGRVLFKPIHAKFGAKFRGFGVGGARFDPAIAASLHDLGFPFFQGYGMTETSALSTLTPMGIDGGLSCGKALEQATIAIESPDPAGIGEIKIRGPHLMTGYWREEQATAEVLQDGWLRTGDLGRLAADGRLHVTGRKKDVIVLSSGKNVFPEPLEQYFQSRCQLIAEMCICCLRDTGGVAERLHGVIVPDFDELRRRGIVHSRDAILYELQSAGKGLAAHERLHGFEIRQTPLPRTSARKIMRYRILEELESGQIAVAENAPPEESMGPAGLEVVEIIRRMKGVSDVRASMDLELDLGFDSLERVELLANVQDRLRVTIPETAVQRILTVGQLVEAIERGEAADESAPGAAERAWSGILNDPLTAEEQRLADDYLGSRPIAAPLLFVLTRIFCLIVRMLLRVNYRASAPWPTGRAYVIAGNHQSHLDTPLLMGRLPYHDFKRICFLSTSRLHGNIFQVWFGRTVRALPIDADRHLRSALRIAAEALRRGMVLCVFPEGHRSMDETIQPFRKGLAILAVDQKAGVVPLGIAGTGKVWGRGSNRIRLGPVSMRVGTILEPGDMTPEEFNDRLFQAVKRLKES